jgi:hypothetical protein
VSEASELFDTSGEAVAENFARPNGVRRLTQTNVFRSIITAVVPVATTSSVDPFDSSLALKMNRFEYVNPAAGVTPAFVAFIPVGYTPLTCASATWDDPTLITIASHNPPRLWTWPPTSFVVTPQPPHRHERR